MKIKVLFFLPLIILLAGCSVTCSTAENCGKDNYRVTFIGDIHFDGPKYHAVPPSERAQRINFTQWKGTSQKVLAAAGAAQNKDTAPFVIQLGDMIQGDCDNAELQGAAYTDAFAVVKSFFPGKKLLSVLGNHGYRGKSNASLAPDKYLIPLLRKELGKNIELDGTNYAVQYKKDLYIFCDLRKNNIFEFTKKAVENAQNVRHIFFCSHLPVFPCSTGNPGWVVPQFKELIPFLAKHKAIVVCAHIHAMGYIVYKSTEGALAQITVTSMGREWQLGSLDNVCFKSYDDWKKSIKPRFFTLPRYKWSIENLRFFRNEDFLCYRVGFLEPSGFVQLEVQDKKVTAHIFIDDSGRPAKSIILKDENIIKTGV